MQYKNRIAELQQQIIKITETSQILRIKKEKYKENLQKVIFFHVQIGF